MDRPTLIPSGLQSASESTLYDEKMNFSAVKHAKVVKASPATQESSYGSPAKDSIVVHKSKRSLLARVVKKLLCTASDATDSDSTDTSITPLDLSEARSQTSYGSELLVGYNSNVDKIRKAEYPDLEGRAYLDNAGTQLPAKSLIDSFAKDLGTHLYGNPHTHSLPARNSASRVAAVRKRALEFFHADPEEFDLVFVANASAAIKLVGEALGDYVNAWNVEHGDEKPKILRYKYHKDAHNSLIGLREFAGASNTQVFCDEAEVNNWISSASSSNSEDDTQDDLTLFAYPGQSNMTGQRLPMRWLKEVKQHANTYTLLDAAGLATTKQLDLSSWAPDFTALSFYKIFGFPDLGALIVRKSAAHLLAKKKYFAGGTVDGVTVLGPAPMMIRRESIHKQLEEGTLPFHNIIALDHALDTHARLFGDMNRISAHVTSLTRYCAAQLQTLTYPGTSQPLCHIYTPNTLFANDSTTHGGTIALNLYTSTGSKIAYRTVERAADAAGVFVRSGAVCNPGGMATNLGWTPRELERVFEAGLRCSKPIEVWEGKWTGVVRVSFGAASSKGDVDALVRFLRREYLLGEKGICVF